MILPIVKNFVEHNGLCNIPQTLTYNYFDEFGKLGAAAFASFTENAIEERDRAFLEFRFDDSLEERAEIYRITVSEKQITVGFRDARGAVNGAATAALLLRKKELRCGEILDYPACEFRSLLLDLARGTVRPEDIENTVKYMALAKYNRIHLHLMDSYGLCYLSDAVPEFRFTPPDKIGNNYQPYDKQFLRDLSALCKGYAIEIIPEIEIPAHGAALCEAHPEFKCQVENAKSWAICPGNDDIWRFFDKLIGEVVDLFPDSKALHIGSDELEFKDLPEERGYICHWDDCPRCAALRKREGLADRQAEFYYLIDKIHAIVKSYGKKMIMWNDQIDISKDVPISRDILLEFWRIAYPGRGPYEGCTFNGFLEKGFTLYNAWYPWTYLDLESYMTPDKMKSWTPFTKPEQNPRYANQVIGGEACVWEMGNYAEYPFFRYTLPPSIALFGDKVWAPGDREHTEEFREALAEFVFGSAEFTEIFDCIGDLVPPRKAGKYTYVAPENLQKDVLNAAIDRLQNNCKAPAAEAYSSLLQKILEDL